MGLIVPAILPSSRLNLEEQLAFLTRIPSVTRIQIDVVDGHLATPASWPYSAPGEFEMMRRESIHLPYSDHITYEIDLMCLDAAQATGDWLALGASRLTFHIESIVGQKKFFASLRAKFGGDLITFGIALNVGSDIALIEPHLTYIGYVQFMGIAKIGQQGQPFDPRVLKQVRAFHVAHPEVPVQVDGGITLEHARELRAAGAGDLIIGSGILRAKDPIAALSAFEALENPYGV